MRQVFSLQVDQVGVAVNQPETAAYVVRVLDTRPDGTQLWEEFQQASYQTYRSASRSDTQEVMEAWEKQVEKETGYEWIGVGEEGS
jgi:hypothetical protein